MQGLAVATLAVVESVRVGPDETNERVKLPDSVLEGSTCGDLAGELRDFAKTAARNDIPDKHQRK